MSDAAPSPWRVTAEAASYLRKGPKFVRGEVKAGRLRAARVGGRGDLVFHVSWLDAYLEALAAPIEVAPLRRVG